jgi:hypothetical protein
MEGSVRLEARLSRKADGRGEDIIGRPWEGHNELHQALLKRVGRPSDELSGTVRMSFDDIVWLRDQQPSDALDAALDDLAENPSLIVEYTWKFV